ncbi:GTP-binding protein EngB required for normal cell division [Marmoricola sp. OAE513]|uniref:GTPase n=1 Tax=Marmoricola sp. OAE513 TaxID=2817894 RepID=UPI001AE730B4
MTSLLEGPNNLGARGTEIGVRVKGLDAAVGAARGRLDDALLAPATEVVGKAAERLRLSADHTVVALGGATGSGKSSTFNALVGLELASVGVRRPTTSWASACTWGTNGASELLQWLGIPPRHQVVRDSMLDTGREPKDMDGLVLLDMPDHDSTEVAHHLEVERLVRLADLLIWVLDPQKYADAAIHDRYLRPLAAHTGVMIIVLNHIDEVAEERRPGMLADLRRLLDADGLHGISLIPISAREGIGIEDLRKTLIAKVADKAATKARLATNLTEVAGAIAKVNGQATPPVIEQKDRDGLRQALAEAAGVPVVVDAVRKASLVRAQRATGWPAVSWVARLRRDPIKHLQLGASDREFIASARSAVPDTNQVQIPRVDGAVRDLADRLSAPLTRPWQTAVSRAATAQLPEISARLDRAVMATDLEVGRTPAWTQLVRGLQWVLLLAAVAGGVWWAGVSAADLPDPEVGGVLVPALLLVGGLLGGLLLALGCRAAIGSIANGRAERAESRLRAAVEQVADELVIAPLTVELDAYRATTENLRIALG